MSIEEYVINIREWKMMTALENKAFYIAEELGTHSTIHVNPDDYVDTGSTYEEKKVYRLRYKENGIA